MEDERARLRLLLERSEEMLRTAAASDDPSLFPVVVRLQEQVLELRAELAALEKTNAV